MLSQSYPVRLLRLVRRRTDLEQVEHGQHELQSMIHDSAAQRSTGRFILRSSNIPTPFEIKQIIDPAEPHFKPNAAYYVRLQKRREEEEAFAWNDDEAAYVKKYEEHTNNWRKQ
jgi:hypothetical protein